MTGKCDGCGKVVKSLVAVTDHPEVHDGNYCEECNPYEKDRRKFEGQWQFNSKPLSPVALALDSTGPVWYSTRQDTQKGVVCKR